MAARQSWLRLLLGLAIVVVALKLVTQAAHTLHLYTTAPVRLPAGQRGAGAAGKAGAAHAAGSREASTVPALIKSFVSAPLPPRNTNLSEQAPLFFFHQRKAAGSSLRASIVDAAAANNLTYYVPCYNNVSCDLYHIATHKAAVFAGHFVWGEQRELSRRSTFDRATGTWHNPRNNASCLTMFRDPIARLESCYYFRFVQERAIRDGHFSCLSNLKAREIRSMFLEGRTLYGRGCLNEPFRILSGLSDEADLASLSRSTTAEGSALSAALTLTLSHLSGCVPLVLEEPRSMELARHWFPQLAPAFQELEQRNKGLARRCPLTERARAVLQELSVGEQTVYDAARWRVAVMLAALPKGSARSGGGAATADEGAS